MTYPIGNFRKNKLGIFLLGMSCPEEAGFPLGSSRGRLAPSIPVALSGWVTSPLGHFIYLFFAPTCFRFFWKQNLNCPPVVSGDLKGAESGSRSMWLSGKHNLPIFLVMEINILNSHLELQFSNLKFKCGKIKYFYCSLKILMMGYESKRNRWVYGTKIQALHQLYILHGSLSPVPCLSAP